MRPLSEIRRHLLLQRLYAQVVSLGKKSSKALTDHDIQLVHVETRNFDVYVEYKHKHLNHTATFPIAMLDAEIEGWLRISPFVLDEPDGQKEQDAKQ